MATVNTGRRRFLTMMGATMACGGIPLGCASEDGSGSGSRPIAAPHARDVPVGFIGVATAGLLLGRDAGGLYAMTATCTHNQCDLTNYGTFTASGISCGCHGSMFSPTGQAIHGPAIDPLEHFKVTVGADDAWAIDRATVVAATERTPVAG
jgi:nitrite reductase/ring-hydroxylating ferredoxin subunit